MNHVTRLLETSERFAEEERAREAGFIGPKTDKAWQVRVGDIIDFRDRFNGNRYVGKVLAFGDGTHVGSLQMRVQVYAFNGQWSKETSSNSGNDKINIVPEELISIMRRN